MYVVFGGLVGIAHTLLGLVTIRNLNLLFDYNFLSLNNGQALTNSILWIVTSMFGFVFLFDVNIVPTTNNNKNTTNRSLFLCLIVERAKKCLDFTATFYIFHLFACTWYNQQFPSSWQWWVLTILAASIMTTIGEQLCMYVELQDIKIDVRSIFFSHFNSNVSVVTNDSPQ